MKKVQHKTRRTTQEPDEILSPSLRKRLRRQLKDLHDPIRYVISNSMLPDHKWVLFLNVADETWCAEIGTATLFKRKHYAKAIADIFDRKSRRELHITKITTHGKRRRLLKYRALSGRVDR